MMFIFPSEANCIRHAAALRAAARRLESHPSKYAASFRRELWQHARGIETRSQAFRAGSLKAAAGFAGTHFEDSIVVEIVERVFAKLAPLGRMSTETDEWFRKQKARELIRAMDARSKQRKERPK